MHPYLNLAIGAPRRLAFLRREALKDNWVRPMTWRTCRFAKFNCAPDWGQGYNTRNAGTSYETRTPVWYTHSSLPFRTTWADEVDGSHIDHKGWYDHPDTSTVYRGLVIRLPHGRFLAGYHMTMNGESVIFQNVYSGEDGAIDAALDADSEAQYYAEKEYEYQERFIMKAALADELDDLQRNFRRMFKLRHTDGFDSASDYRDIEWHIEKMRDTKNKLKDYKDIEL